MAKKFSGLRAKMPPEAQAQADAKAHAILAEISEGLPQDDPEIQEWMNMKPMGLEFGASVMEKFAQFSPDFLAEGRGDQEQVERDFSHMLP